jgi:hypothetical protein
LNEAITPGLADVAKQLASDALHYEV